MSSTKDADHSAEETPQTDPAAGQGDLPAGPPEPSAGTMDRLSKRSEWSNLTVLALIVLCLFVIFYLWPYFSTLEVFKPDVTGQGLSQLDLQPLVGVQRSVTLGDLTGRVVLLNFWGTWCPPCRVEFPHLVAIREKFRDQTAFKFLSVSCPPPGERVDLEKLRYKTNFFLQQFNVEMPIYADPDLISHNAVGLEGYPTTLIIDRRGAIRRVWTGYMPGYEVEMEELVSKLLEEG